MSTDTTQVPQPIIDLILADTNAILSNLSTLVTSYRLLVGAAEEVHRTPEICPEVFERAVRRADNAGTLIDMFIELLYSKIAFSSDFLKISCAPVDLFRLLANPTTATDIPFQTAEQVVEIEILRRIVANCMEQSLCMPQHTVVCPKPQPPPPPHAHAPEKSTDIQDVQSALLAALQSKLDTTRQEPLESRVRRKHLKDPYDTTTRIKR